VYKCIFSVLMERQTLFVYENCYAYVSAMQVCVCVYVNNLRVTKQVRCNRHFESGEVAFCQCT